MSEPNDNIVDRIMEKAARADRRALFGALQQALDACIAAEYGQVRPGTLALVERQLDIRAPVGSPEHLAHVNAEAAGTIEGSGE